MKKTELLNKIATLLGGRAAEEIVFGDISTGAHNDLAKATDIARSMVKEYGMSATMGQVYFSREKRPLFLEPETRCRILFFTKIALNNHFSWTEIVFHAMIRQRYF